MLVGTLLLAVAFEVFQCVCALHCTDFGITTSSSSSHRVSTAVITMATVCQPHAAIVTNSRCNAAPGIFGRALWLVEANTHAHAYLYAALNAIIVRLTACYGLASDLNSGDIDVYATIWTANLGFSRPNPSNLDFLDSVWPADVALDFSPYFGLL